MDTEIPAFVNLTVAAYEVFVLFVPYCCKTVCYDSQSWTVVT